MSCKINFFSLNETPAKRYLRGVGILSAREAYRRGLNIFFKRMHKGLLSFPQIVHIEVTNYCNLTCPMCVYYDQKRPRGFMEFGLFEKIVQQCKGKRFLDKMALMGLGEPFLHPELIEMSRYAKAHKIYHVFTSTNGTLLNEKMSEAIVAQPGFDVIAVSLDGATKATYERIRKGADFDSVVKNIKTLIEIRKRLKKKRPGLVLQFLVMRENHQEKEAFIAFWEKYLSVFDIILIRDVDTFGGQVPDHRLASQVPRLKRRRCLQLWRDMIISWNGEVSVCCKDVNYLLKVGNVHEASLRDIWNSAQWNRLRLLHRQGRWDDIHLCSQCSEWG